MKILITGASGYIGSFLFKALTSDYQVIGTYYKNKLFENLYHIDINNQTILKNFLQTHKPKIIIHTAGIAHGLSSYSSQDIIQTNSTAIEPFIQYSRQNSTQFIFLSTFAAISPKDAYGQSKNIAEQKIRAKLHDYAILRLSLTIGISPNQKAKVFFNDLLHAINSSQTTFLASDSWKFNITSLHHLLLIIRTLIHHNTRNNIQNTIPVIAKGKTSKYKIAYDILSNFNIQVKKDNKPTTRPYHKPDFILYKKLNLPITSYDIELSKIIEDMHKMYK